MDRRRFLRNAAIAGAAVAWPGWLKRAFADSSVGARGGSRLGKPLFAIVIPDDDREKDRRGDALGQWLAYGSAAEMAPLALVEVACLRADKLWSIARRPTGAAREPLFALVEDGAAAVVHFNVSAYGPGDVDELIDHRITRLAAEARALIAGTPALVEKRVARARAALPAAEVAALDARLARGEIPSAVETDRFAALVWSRAVGPRAPILVERLADAACARLRDRPPDGSHWAYRRSCGGGFTVAGMSDIGDEQGNLIGCGMGSLPAHSARFLYLYAQPPRLRALVEEAEAARMALEAKRK